MCEAIIALSPNNILTRNLSQRNKIRLHWCCMVPAVMCTVFGLLTVYLHRERNSKPHFASTHGLYGIWATGLSLLTCTNGLFALYARELKRFIKPNITKLIHGVCGATAFVLGNIAFVYAFDTKFYKRVAGENLVTGSTWAFTFVTVWCLVRPLLNAFSRLTSFF